MTTEIKKRFQTKNFKKNQLIPQKRIHNNTDEKNTTKTQNQYTTTTKIKMNTKNQTKPIQKIPKGYKRILETQN